MTSHMDATLREMIQTTLDSFLLSLRGKSTELTSFLGAWTNLQGLIQTHQDKLQEETLTMAHNFASVVNTVATSMIELQDESDRLCRETLADISTILDQEMDKLSISTQPNHSSCSTTTPAFKPSYEWLLSNLHNPYPSKEIKDTISYQTASTRKEVDEWFVNIRKRIGWNRLRLKHYSNKRSKIVDAATRFFKEIHQASHYEPCATHMSGIDAITNHDSEFKAIENRAKDLYSNELFETSLATRLDGSVRNPSPESKVRAQAQGNRRQEAKSKRGKDLQCLSVYPSPEPSPERSPERSPDFPLPIPDFTRTTSRKRPDRDFPELDIEDRCDGPQKRSRLDSYHLSRDLGIASLPSPAASLHDIPRDSSVALSDETPSENDCVILPTPPIPAAPSGKRKRRLSDAGNDGPPKRPHNALAVPRLQTVSDPLPLANSIISEWCKTWLDTAVNDTIPGPVSVESLDDTQVEVDFYNYNASPDTIQPFLLANSSLSPSPTTSLLLAASSEPPSLDKSQVTEVPDPNFEFLFETYLQDLSASQASTDMPLFPDIPPHDPSTLFPFENMLPIQAPQEEVLSDPLSYFQIPSVSWELRGNVNSFPATVPSAGTLFSSDHVPLQDNPPQVDPTQNEKEAKLKKIEALRAQLQNLEAEAAEL